MPDRTWGSRRGSLCGVTIHLQIVVSNLSFSCLLGSYLEPSEVVVLKADIALIIIAILEGRHSCKIAKEPPHLIEGGSIPLDGESVNETEAHF
jgi:hypothetical protein